MAEIASGSIDLKSLKKAGAGATSFITVDTDGIQIHKADAPNVNYSKITDEGLEVFKETASVAKFSANTRIGQEGAGRIELDSKSISLITDTGLPALKSETSAVPITGRSHVAINEEIAPNNTDITRTLDLSYIPNGTKFYILITSSANYTVAYYAQELKKKIVIDEQLGGASFEFEKSSTGGTTQVRKYVDIPHQIILFNSNTPDVLVNFQSITVTVDYTPPNTIRIRHAAFDSSISDSTSTYSGATIGVTEASSKLKFDEIFCDKTINIPKTQIYGRCYLELNDDNTNNKVADKADLYISTIVKNRGWDIGNSAYTGCLVEDNQNNTALDIKALLTRILNCPMMIDSGTDDIWHYRKWSDGTAECWALQAKSFTMTSGYGVDEFYTTSSELFPSGLFKSGTQPVVIATRQGQDTSGLVTISVYSVDNTSMSYYVFNSGVVYSPATIGIAIHVYGVWK